MKRGINRALLSGVNRAIYENQNIQHANCVFISHKSEDIEIAKQIADLLQAEGVDVYLDVNDSGLQIATKEGNADEIVKCIEKALMVNTDILVLVTDKTKESWWVPYEVGFAKMGKKSIASLLLKNVSEFPDYLKIEKKLNGLADLKRYINEKQSLPTFMESVKAGGIAKDIEAKLLNYIRG